MKENFSPTQDDKIISAIAQGAVILPIWGIIVATIIWITQREKSEYVRDQALQALVWQGTQVGLWFLGMACYVSTFFLTFGSMAVSNPETMTGPPPAFFLPFCVMGVIFVGFFGFIIVGVWAAVRNLQGETFTYPLVGERARAYVNK